MMKTVIDFRIVLLLFGLFVATCNGHGRLIEPPSRASAWRYGFQTPPNYNDHELYCGGFTRQWKTNGGNCGECGDPFDAAKPRPHEWGGKYGQGVIVRKYNPGSIITIRIELTASHMGYFEFRVCDNVNAPQTCLDKHTLKIISGTPSIFNPNDLKTRFYPRNGSRIYEMKAELPDDLQCSNCVLQWKYIAGNNWGICEDGNGAVGCGPQEEFRACADIAIGEGKATLRPPVRPGHKTKPTPTAATEKPTVVETTTEIPQGNKYVGPLVALLSLFLVLCGFAAVYLYHYHGGRVKKLMIWNRSQSHKIQDTASSSSQSDLESNPPVPPPRTKRISQIREIGAEESSVLTGSVITRNTHQNDISTNPPECA